jgi:hypothetical protein
MRMDEHEVLVNGIMDRIITLSRLIVCNSVKAAKYLKTHFTPDLVFGFIPQGDRSMLFVFESLLPGITRKYMA